MAQLILTDEEKAAHSWLHLDDESLGRLVKYSALAIAGHDVTDGGKVRGMTNAIMLATMAHEANAETTTVELKGVTQDGVGIGDWRITIERTAK